MEEKKFFKMVSVKLQSHIGDDPDSIAQEVGEYLALAAAYNNTKGLGKIKLPQRAFGFYKTKRAELDVSGRPDFRIVKQAGLLLIQKLDSKQPVIEDNTMTNKTTHSPRVKEFIAAYEQWVTAYNAGNRERPKDALLIHVPALSEDRDDIDFYIDSHSDTVCASLYTKAYNRAFRDSQLHKAAPEQRDNIIKRGLLYHFTKWASVALAAVPNAVVAIWQWLRSIPDQWHEADGALEKTLVVGKNLVGWELAKNVWKSTVGVHIDAQPDEGTYYTPLDAIKTNWCR